MTTQLKDFIKMQKKKIWEIPEEPSVLAPQRNNMPVLGPQTKQVYDLDMKAMEN